MKFTVPELSRALDLSEASLQVLTEYWVDNGIARAAEPGTYEIVPGAQGRLTTTLQTTLSEIQKRRVP